MEDTNGKTLADYRPDVASDAVLDELQRHPGNRHDAAGRLAIQSAPIEILTPAQQRGRRELAEVDAKRAAVLAKLEADSLAVRARDNKKAQVEAKRQQLAGAERAEALCAGDAAGFAADIAEMNWATADGFASALERGKSAAIAAHLTKVLPGVITKLRNELAAMEAELKTLQTAAEN